MSQSVSSGVQVTVLEMEERRIVVARHGGLSAIRNHAVMMMIHLVGPIAVF
jgi:hypothetical protein